MKILVNIDKPFFAGRLIGAPQPPPPPPPPLLRPHHWPFDGYSLATTTTTTTTTTNTRTTTTTTTTTTTLPASADHLSRNCMNAIDLRTKPVTLRRQYSVAMLSSTNNLLVATDRLNMPFISATSRGGAPGRYLRGSSLLYVRLPARPSVRPSLRPSRSSSATAPAEAHEPLHLLPMRFVQNWPSVLKAVDCSCRKCGNGVGKLLDHNGYLDVVVMH